MAVEAAEARRALKKRVEDLETAERVLNRAIAEQLAGKRGSKGSGVIVVRDDWELVLVDPESPEFGEFLKNLTGRYMDRFS